MVAKSHLGFFAFLVIGFLVTSNIVLSSASQDGDLLLPSSSLSSGNEEELSVPGVEPSSILLYCNPGQQYVGRDRSMTAGICFHLDSCVALCNALAKAEGSATGVASRAGCSLDPYLSKDQVFCKCCK